MNTYLYSFIYWLIWLALMPVILKHVSLGSELICIVTYSILGSALYFSLPVVVDIFLDKIEHKRYEEQKMWDENRKRFLKEQYLRKRYRYIKLNVKENIINSSINRNDKLFLLETIHGCTPDEANQLLEAAER